jgi:hypothetical protein
MKDTNKTADVFRLAGKIGALYAARMLEARRAYLSHLMGAAADLADPPDGETPDPGQAWPAYVVDSVQRGILFWDTMRQRGNNFLEHERAGKPPLLAFDYEIIMDGRKLPRPVNYALVRIVPPDGAKIDPDKRPLAYLATPYARRITGSTAYVDAGLNIMA